jgi:hypothetical protein
VRPTGSTGEYNRASTLARAPFIWLDDRSTNRVAADLARRRRTAPRSSPRPGANAAASVTMLLAAPPNLYLDRTAPEPRHGVRHPILAAAIAV